MKKIIAAASMMFCSMAFAATSPAVPASAAVAKPASQAHVHSAQQQKMVDCNKQATGKKGAERKSFMSTCLKKSPVTAPVPTAASSVK